MDAVKRQDVVKTIKNKQTKKNRYKGFLLSFSISKRIKSDQGIWLFYIKRRIVCCSVDFGRLPSPSPWGNIACLPSFNIRSAL